MTTLDTTDIEPDGMPRIIIEPRSPTIGAEVSGIDLGRPLSDDTIAIVRRALLDWKVLMFRDQDITTEQHLEFARRFGQLEVHPFAPEKPGHPEVLAITHDADSPGYENVWHSDVTWRLDPSLGSILRALEVPDVGGDTVFADMYAAYDGLPGHIRTRVEGRVARHDFTGFRRRLRREGATEEELEQFDSTYPNPHHPVIRTHPETGRKLLYVNDSLTPRFDGMTDEESRPLLEFLFRHLSQPAFTFRHKWEVGDLVFWDNRPTQHIAPPDYDIENMDAPENHRYMRRTTIAGDKPY